MKMTTRPTGAMATNLTPPPISTGRLNQQFNSLRPLWKDRIGKAAIR